MSEPEKPRLKGCERDRAEYVSGLLCFADAKEARKAQWVSDDKALHMRAISTALGIGLAPIQAATSISCT